MSRTNAMNNQRLTRRIRFLLRYVRATFCGQDFSRSDKKSVLGLRETGLEVLEGEFDWGVVGCRVHQDDAGDEKTNGPDCAAFEQVLLQPDDSNSKEKKPHRQVVLHL